MRTRIGTCEVGGICKRALTFATTLVALAALCASAPAQAQWAYDWGADEYLLSYGNAGFVTFKINYNLITYRGEPVQSFDIKILNRGTVRATIDSVVYSGDRWKAWVTARGTYTYQAYELVNGRWTLVEKEKSVLAFAEVLQVRLRAAYVALRVVGADDSSLVYDSGGFYPYLFYTLMK